MPAYSAAASAGPSAREKKRNSPMLPVRKPFSAQLLLPKPATYEYVPAVEFTIDMGSANCTAVPFRKTATVLGGVTATTTWYQLLTTMGGKVAFCEPPPPPTMIPNADVVSWC